jgi:hypothetical protein
MVGSKIGRLKLKFETMITRETAQFLLAAFAFAFLHLFACAVAQE